MMSVTVVLFCLAAGLGLWIIVIGLRYKRGSMKLALGHAAVAVVGLGLLLQQIFAGPKHLLYNDAAFLFALALVGGLVLLALRISERKQRKPPSMFVVGIHGFMAMSGLLLLLIGYARY